MLVYIFVFVLGTIFASFIHLYATRLLRGESIVTPRSHCPKCNHTLRVFELIPIVSYLIQKGRCRNCQSKIGCDSLVVEVVTGILFVLVYCVYGISLETILGWVLVLVMLSIFITDFKEMVILDSTIIAGSLLVYILRFMIGGLWEGLYKGLLYGIFAFVLMFVIKVLGDWLFKRESLGGGDIKFAFLMGSVLPYNLFLISLILASFTAFPYAVFATFGKSNREVAFGPFLALGLFMTFLFQTNLLELLDILIK